MSGEEVLAQVCVNSVLTSTHPPWDALLGGLEELLAGEEALGLLDPLSLLSWSRAESPG